MLAPGAFGADGAVSRAIPTSQAEAKTQEASNRGTVARVATRSADSEKGSVNNSDVVARSAVSRTLPVVSGEKQVKVGGAVQQVKGAVVSRSAGGANSVRSNLNETVNTIGRNKRVSDASINSNPAVRRLGITLRPSTAEVGGRAVIGDTGVQTGSNIDEKLRAVHSRAAKDMNAETIAEATTRLEQTAELNKSCQEQYNDCMDQFCAVIDANQGRCSCSSNLTKYTKVEEAVKDANNKLNEVAQRIRYVGLSADEIRAILTETEAEEALAGTKDTSANRNMLEQIEDLIRDPVSSSSAYNSVGDFGLDMDLNFSAGEADLFNLDFLDSGSTGSFSNLRGGELYRAAKKRCNAVLNQCKDAGSTTSQITGNYDLAIDKDCIAYEKGLKKMNETLISNVGSANRMLQKARLAVLQNKNMYDAKGCIGALETCMKDEMVCGENYFKCVDPTKKYIDENGQVVLGQRTANIIDYMQNYNNASIDRDFLQTAYKDLEVSDDNCKLGANRGNAGGCVANYLLQKVGTKQNVTDEGLCRAVLDKCQAYTYDASGNYDSYNDVVVNYVQRAMVNIRAAQSKIIADYASKCIVDVADCYNQQVTQVNSWSTSANVGSIRKVLAGACRNVALTCAYAVFKDDANSCPIGSTGAQTCITSISEMFYQSLLCPENSTYQATPANSGEIGTTHVNDHCKCNAGYDVWGTSCLVACASDETRDSYGLCQKSVSTTVIDE
ncbi:MAG: hypothetical protein II208_03940 [Alphaproteobacteria bacterium]|nr:hypothetical protein [Alphaproteobacteria bacterium]